MKFVRSNPSINPATLNIELSLMFRPVIGIHNGNIVYNDLSNPAVIPYHFVALRLRQDSPLYYVAYNEHCYRLYGNSSYFFKTLRPVRCQLELDYQVRDRLMAFAKQNICL